MNRLFVLLYFILFVVLSGFSQSSVWTIEGKGTKIYVGGSIHLLREKDYPLPMEFEKAYKQSDILVLEADINPKDKNKLRSELIGLTLYPNNKSLKTELRDDVYQKLDSAFKSSGLKLESMIGFKPVMAMLTLTQVELFKLGVTVRGVDMYFLEKANQQGKNILFLEKAEDQIKLIVEMGGESENEYVLESLKELKNNRDFFTENIESWRKGVTSGMLEQINTFKREYPEFYRSFLVERNNNWIPQLEKYMESPEKEFVVVGAMHLFGPDGILQQMKDKGYEVRQF